MKKITITLQLILLITISGAAQYVQNFESLSAGDYIAVNDTNWTTWSNLPGSTEDVKIDTTRSYSGFNSLMFESYGSSGGPQDVTVHYGPQKVYGQVTVEMAMYVEAGHGAYFNIQGDVPKGSGGLTFRFLQTGILHIAEHDGPSSLKSLTATTTYPTGQWFELKLEVDLNTNTLLLTIDNNPPLRFESEMPFFGAIDFFPFCSSNLGGNDSAKFWVDDVKFSVTPYTFPTLNAVAYSLTHWSPLVHGTVHNPVFGFRNLGLTRIDSISYEVEYNGVTKQQSTGHTILDTNTIYKSIRLRESLLSPGFVYDSAVTTMKVTITQINGQAFDDVGQDNEKVVNLNFIKPVLGKKVLVETHTEASSTETFKWLTIKRFYHGMTDYLQPIYVHHSDPYEFTSYYKELYKLVGSANKVLFNRQYDSPLWVSLDSLSANMQREPVATIQGGARTSLPNQTIEVSMAYNFMGFASNTWKVACVLVEDSIMANSFNGRIRNDIAGHTGNDFWRDPLGVDYRQLPFILPYSESIHNHVARAVSPNFYGNSDLFSGTVNPGDTLIANFVFPMDPGWDTSHLKVVGLLIRPDGVVDNISSLSLAEATNNGFESGQLISLTEVLQGPDTKVRMFPNPCSRGYVMIGVETLHKKLEIEVFNISGKRVLHHVRSNTEEFEEIKLLTNNLQTGVYTVHIYLDGMLETHPLIIE